MPENVALRQNYFLQPIASPACLDHQALVAELFQDPLELAAAAYVWAT